MAIRLTNRGTPIDMDSFLAANKDVRAIGNMRVNAAGDVIGPGGEVIQKNEDRVRAYYKNNPKASTSKASLKGKMPGITEPGEVEADAPMPKNSETLRENKRTTKSKTTAAIKPDVPAEPEEFDAPQEPLGYKEVEMPNGDIEMVPVYKKEDL